MTFDLISQRLREVLQATIDGEPLADIGTDHALLPIAAVASGRVPSGIGIDRAPNALAAGRQNVEESDLADRIDLRLGEGLDPLTPADALSTIVMAGVGARTLLDVMDTERLGELGVSRLVLQPNQSEIDARRAIFTRSGWRLADETLVEDDGRFYVVFHVDLDPAHRARELADIPAEEQLLGSHLRRRGGELFRAYAAELAKLLEPHLVDVEHMPTNVRERLEKRLEVFRRAAIK